MIRQRRGKNCQTDIEMHPHSPYVEAATSVKRECDKVLDLVVDDMLGGGSKQLAEAFEVVVEVSRKADALWRWAVQSGIYFVKVPYDKIRELQDIQLALAVHLTEKRDGT